MGTFYGYSIELEKPPHISFDLARPKHDCTRGIWICNFKAEVDLQKSFATIVDITNKTLTLRFNQPISLTEMFGEDGEEVVLDAQLASQLGYSSIVIVPGRYKLSSSSEGHKQVVLNIRTR